MSIPYGLLEPHTLPLPHLPRALNGLRIAHLSDTHIRRELRSYGKLANQLTSQRFDIVVLTGDFMDRLTPDEQVAHHVLAELCHKLRPRIGTFGVFGNHDTATFRERCADLPVHWLHNQAWRAPEQPIEIMGLDMVNGEAPDAVALAFDHLRVDQAMRASAAELQAGEKPLRLMLSHLPRALTVATHLGADLVLAGHTHGGQCRLPTGHALFNASDLPLRLTSGILRCRNTLAAVSRGIGWGGPVPRIFCRPHVPVYTLRRATLPGIYTRTIENVQPW